MRTVTQYLVIAVLIVLFIVYYVYKNERMFTIRDPFHDAHEDQLVQPVGPFYVEESLSNFTFLVHDSKKNHFVIKCVDERFQAQLAMLPQLDHPHVVKHFALFHTSDSPRPIVGGVSDDDRTKVCIVKEYCAMGNVNDVIGKRKISERVRNKQGV